ncbi:hypothetical protein BAUCODRAFT_36628 [Baudoinia panamericana UAMH 10762]|uniref:Uncharacterized protein n=1 Tax=Baudoinia panamericana (strain UAMH 10762) TaxID=717646 RepID=M2LIX2_BAUPA|nr:uncharacterized protein BAUCODRAFT_36628 [Baudoinia panamericana UAMH 10762]EMC94152.1 hypothetical protein BAUCODRAFT_36628 [Baudoinia panamericana UAMH 10762]
MASDGTASIILIVIITIFRTSATLYPPNSASLERSADNMLVPPVGVFLISGCSADLLINILLTCLGYFPGHVSAAPPSPSLTVRVYFRYSDADFGDGCIVDPRFLPRVRLL